jgi:hypothetical protein
VAVLPLSFTWRDSFRDSKRTDHGLVREPFALHKV